MLEQAGLKHINDEDKMMAVLDMVETQLPIGDYDKCIVFFVKDDHDTFSMVSSTMRVETLVISLNSALSQALDDANDSAKSQHLH